MRKAAFTHSDLLTGLAVVTSLVFVALPVVGRVRAVNASAICLSNTRQLVRA